MKKISIIALLVLGISTLVGCKPDSQLIIGTWKGENVTQYDKEGNVIGKPQSITDQFIKFEKDGSGAMGNEQGSAQFKYTFDGKTITLKSPDGKDSTVFSDVELSEKSLKYRVDASYGSVAYVIYSYSR